MHLMKPIARHRAFDAMPPTIGCGWLRQLHNQFIQKKMGSEITPHFFSIFRWVAIRPSAK